MAEAPFDLEQAHRWFAVQFNNTAWDLIEANAADVDRLVNLAHAACYHWAQVGTSLNHQRAEDLLTRAYVTAGRSEPALHHARRCLELSDEANLDDQTDFDRATAFECVARANALAGLGDEASRFKKMAGEAGDRITDAEERGLFEKMLAGGDWYGVN